MEFTDNEKERNCKILQFPDKKEEKLKAHREKTYENFIKFHVPLKDTKDEKDETR